MREKKIFCIYGCFCVSRYIKEGRKSARSVPRNRRKCLKSRKSDQTLNQTKRDINKLCLGKISLQKTVRMKLSVDSGFSIVFYGKKRKPGNAGNQQKAF